MPGDRPDTGVPSEAEIRDGVRRLTSIERIIATRLIERQFAHGRNTAREMRKYGLDGTLKLYSARAIGLYMIALAAIGIGLALGGQVVAAVVTFLLLWLTLIPFLIRCASAARAGRRWRGSLGAR